MTIKPVTFRKGDLVISRMGRDANRLMFVLQAKEKAVSVADGRLRHIEKPKVKNPSHIMWVSSPDSPVAEKIRSGEKLTNSELRRAIAEYQDANDLEPKKLSSAKKGRDANVKG